MTLTTDIATLEALKAEWGYSRFDAAVRAINRKRLQGERAPRKKFPWSKYRKLYDRQRGICPECKLLMPLVRGHVEIDHFDPNEQDFNNESNLRLTHTLCNRSKGAKSVLEQSKASGRTFTDMMPEDE